MKEEEESPENEPIKEEEVAEPITNQEEVISDDQVQPTPEAALQQEPIRSPEQDQPMDSAEQVPHEAQSLDLQSPEQTPEQPIESTESVTYQEPISFPEQATDEPVVSPERPVPEEQIRSPQYVEPKRSPIYEVPMDRLADDETEIRESIDERIPKNGEPALLIETSETVRSLYRESPSGQVISFSISKTNSN